MGDHCGKFSVAHYRVNEASHRYRHLNSVLLACPVSSSQVHCSFIPTAGVLLALSLSLSCQSKLDKAGPKTPSSGESTDSQTADLIARVKDVSASELEKGAAYGRIRRLAA